MLIVTTDTIPGKKIKNVFGLVIGRPASEKGLFSSMVEDTELLMEANITKKAEEKGANAIIGFQMTIAGGGPIKTWCCGTAVLIEDEAMPLREETLVMQPDVDPNGDDTRVNKPA